jgi:hypothetical protein
MIKKLMNRLGLATLLSLLRVTAYPLMATEEINCRIERFTEEESNDFNLEECCGLKISRCNKIWGYSGEINPTVVLRGAAFLPTSERFNEIYGRSIGNYQIEVAGTFFSCYRSWMNLDWVYKKGKSDSLGYFTRVKIGNFSLGLSIPYEISTDLHAYAGIGASFGYIEVQNRFTKIHRNENKFAAGLVVKSGIIYNIHCHYFLDLFIDYLYQPTTFSTNVNIGGLKIGAGIGTRF